MSKAIWSTQQGLDALSSAAKAGFSIEVSEDSPSALFFAERPKEKLTIDFTSGVFLNRLKTSGKNQPLTKAIGLPKGLTHILDLSAGLGGDAYVLAHLGANVVALERNPVLYCLLQEALDHSRPVAPDTAMRLQFVSADAIQYMQSLSERPEVIYFDPMYPETDSTALPKKEMQMLSRLVGEDQDQLDVIKLALVKATNRVVIKRPLRVPPLLERPTQSFETPTTRWDMYLV